VTHTAGNGGKASTVGRYETEAGVAKIVPLYRTTVGYVRLRPALKAHPLDWGGLGFAHHPAGGYMNSKEVRRLKKIET